MNTLGANMATEWKAKFSCRELNRLWDEGEKE